MLHWVPSPIHTCLMAMEQHPLMTDKEQYSTYHRTATAMHKSVLCCMGDRRYNNPGGVVLELLESGLVHPVIADEIFLQIAKQLTAAPVKDSQSPGPSPEATELGWRILCFCFHVFMPSKHLAPYLECWVRSQKSPHATLAVRLLHQSVLGGNMNRAPSLNELEDVLERMKRRSSAKPSSKTWRIDGAHATFDVKRALEAVVLAPVVKPWKVTMDRAELIDLAGHTDSSSTLRDDTATKVKDAAPKAPVKQADTSSIETYEAEYGYDTTETDELAFKEGDLLKVDFSHPANKELEGWLHAVDSSGNEGIVPENYLKKVAKSTSKAPPAPPVDLDTSKEEEVIVEDEPEGELFVGTHDFEAESPDELKFESGEEIRCTKIDDEDFAGWMYGRNAMGETGLVPTNFLERVR